MGLELFTAPLKTRNIQ